MYRLGVFLCIVCLGLSPLSAWDFAVGGGFDYALDIYRLGVSSGERVEENPFETNSGFGFLTYADFEYVQVNLGLHAGLDSALSDRFYTSILFKTPLHYRENKVRLSFPMIGLKYSYQTQGKGLFSDHPHGFYFILAWGMDFYSTWESLYISPLLQMAVNLAPYRSGFEKTSEVELTFALTLKWDNLISSLKSLR